MLGMRKLVLPGRIMLRLRLGMLLVPLLVLRILFMLGIRLVLGLLVQPGITGFHWC